MRLRITIDGVVQGVGFRPTVYRYALRENLTGFVYNSGAGVTVEIQGSKKSLESFSESLKNNPPSAARIDRFHIREIEDIPEERDFSIQFSEETSGGKTAGISPDLATCPDCLEEIFDKKNRRYGYPFTNCTNCGPRFTIIHDRPYDRPLTTMSPFDMCPRCMKEYGDPLNRRFHAQPNACPDCGPHLALFSRDNESIYGKDPIEETAARLGKGEIGAIKGLGGFHFACDPFQEGTLERLRLNKDRPNKAFALMMRNMEEIRRHCIVSPAEEKTLLSSAAPIVLLRKKGKLLNGVSPDNNYLGVMLPFTPLHHLLLSRIPVLIMTSANRRDEPLAIDDEEVRSFLEEDFIDFYLTNNRNIAHRCDDSIVQIVHERIQFIRRSRGYVPNPVFTDKALEENILSLGADMKNTFSLSSANGIFLSQHIGDLADFRNLRYQKEQISDFSGLLEIEGKNIRTDAHPGYQNYGSGQVRVYHHHAHMLSVTAEYSLSGEPLIGVICDGTGFGTDGAVWGFEFLHTKGDRHSFSRLAHLDYFPLPGGEKAIREIDRLAVSLADSDAALPFSEKRTRQIRDLIRAGINCPPTSSLGRLFDGVAALCRLTAGSEYEARGAILLQREAENFAGDPESRYSVNILSREEEILIDYRPLINEILDDLKNEVRVRHIAWKFHLWTADSILAVLDRFEKTPVLLSGGCFQNRLLTEIVTHALEKSGYTYYINRLVPPNDGGIALGQAYYQQEETDGCAWLPR